MDERCSIEGCPGSPKFTCRQDRSSLFCEYHIISHVSQPGRHEEVLIEDLNKPLKSQLSIENVSILSDMFSEVILTGKGMFQSICEKLCTIIDDLGTRQKDLLKISQSATTQDLSQEIDRLAKPAFKLRSREEFDKLIDQHFSKHDIAADFSLFTEDIQGIRTALLASNSLISELKEQAGKDREDRQGIISRIAKNEDFEEKMRKEFEVKINELEKRVNFKVKERTKKSKHKGVSEKVGKLEVLFKKEIENIKRLESKCENYTRGIGEQANAFENLENSTMMYMNQILNGFEDFKKIIVEINEQQESFRLERLNNFMQQTNEEFTQKTERGLTVINELQEKVYSELASKREKDNRDFNDLCEKTKNDFKIRDERERKRASDVEKMIENIEDYFDTRKRTLNEELAELDRRLNKSLLVKTEDDRKNFEFLSDKIRNETEECVLWMKKSVENYEINFVKQTRKEIDEYNDWKIQETNRILKEIGFKMDIEEQHQAQYNKEEILKQLEQIRLLELQENKSKEYENFIKFEVGMKYIELFNNSTLDIKKKSILKFDLEDYKKYFIDKANNFSILEIRRSNDRKYAFICKNYIGIYY